MRASAKDVGRNSGTTQGGLPLPQITNDSGYAADAAAKCQAAKLKIAAKYSLCSLNAHAKSVKAPVVGQLSEDLAKCTANFDTKWAKAEEKGGADCPTSGDADKINTAVNRVSGDFVMVVSPTRFVDNGDGTITDVRNGLMWEKKDGPNNRKNVAAGQADDRACKHTPAASASLCVPLCALR